MRLGQVKNYTMEELKKRISKKYHDIIDWEATMFYGFDGTFVIKDFGQKRQLLSADDYGAIEFCAFLYFGIFDKEVSKA